MNEINHLSNNFYTMPGAYSTTMTRKQLKETLLATDGWVLACGYGWNRLSGKIVDNKLFDLQHSIWKEIKLRLEIKD